MRRIDEVKKKVTVNLVDIMDIMLSLDSTSECIASRKLVCNPFSGLSTRIDRTNKACFTIHTESSCCLPRFHLIKARPQKISVSLYLRHMPIVTLDARRE